MRMKKLLLVPFLIGIRVIAVYSTAVDEATEQLHGQNSAAIMPQEQTVSPPAPETGNSSDNALPAASDESQTSQPLAGQEAHQEPIPSEAPASPSNETPSQVAENPKTLPPATNPGRASTNSAKRRVTPTKSSGSASKPRKSSGGVTLQTLTGNSSGHSDSAESARVLAAAKAYLSAAASGKHASIARTMTAEMKVRLEERSRWASGAGMAVYQDFAKSFVRFLRSEVRGKEATVYIVCKGNFNGMNSGNFQIEKYNRAEGEIRLVLEAGQWKVASGSEGDRVWNE